MSRKEHRAGMRAKHGPEWWTNPSKRRNSGHYGFSAEKTQSKYHRERDLGLYWTLYIQGGRGRARVGLFWTEHDAKNVARLLNEQRGLSPEPREARANPKGAWVKIGADYYYRDPDTQETLAPGVEDTRRSYGNTSKATRYEVQGERFEWLREAKAFAISNSYAR
jgi:hypothetical protein